LISKFEKKSAEENFSLKSSLVQAINDVQEDSITEENIKSVTIVGKERKHLKVELSKGKISLIKSIKSAKPANLFVNDYLTKSRSHLLYRLRSLRREHASKFDSVYVYSGSVCCRLVNDRSKIIYINNSATLDQLAASINE